MGGRIKKILFFIGVVLIVFSHSVYAETTVEPTEAVKEAENFEDLDWQLLYPDVILEDAAAWIALTGGGFIDEDGPGFYIEMEPGMHFLIFDGLFNVKLVQDRDDFGSFLRLKNAQVSDYFVDTTVRYKELTFNFSDRLRRNSKMVFYPRSDFSRKYVTFDYSWQDWQLFVKSPEWSSWAFDFNTPSLELGNVDLSLSADAFLDNSASLTYAVSGGPKLAIGDFSLTPFVGFESSQKFPDLSEVFGNQDAPASEGRQSLLLGAMGSYEKGVFGIDAGIKYSELLYPFVTVHLGPLEVSTGKNLFLAKEFQGIKEWTDVYWNFKKGILDTNMGFSYEKNHLEEIQLGLFADFEFDILNTVFLDFSVKKTENWLFELGVKYNFKLDFYAEPEEK